MEEEVMSFVLNGVSYLMLSVFVISALGYMLGRITIRGTSLGTAGVFIIALIFGALFGDDLAAQFVIVDVSYASQTLKIVENLGLIFFVSAVGFIAGPNFFKNLKTNYKSYVLLGLVIIIAGGLSAVGCICVGRLLESHHPLFDSRELTAIIAGLFSGALTSTPAFSAIKETVAAPYQDAVTVGYGIAYLFGVIGVVLFVQIMPKIEHVDMEEERKKITSVDMGTVKISQRELIHMDPYGFMPFAAAAVAGILVGTMKIFHFFSLTTTGGTLLVSLLFGHFGHFGPVNVTPSKKVLETFRELGLMCFLIGAGFAGGMSFVKYFKAVYFLYGIVMTVVPMLAGYIVAKYLLKMSLLNSLGSITGGMTSTPALGTLIHVVGSDDIASAYAATYPVALIAVVLISQLIVILL